MNFYSLLCIKPNFVPDYIIDILLKNKSEQYIDASVNINDEYVVNNYRKTKLLALPENTLLDLYNTIAFIHEQTLKAFFNSELLYVDPPQFLRYDVGDGYQVHNDSESFLNNKLIRVAERDISVLLYLNNDYEGGELEFTHLQLKIKPKAGMLIAFPSYLDFEHIVHPVTKGTRYAIASWIATKKRIYARPYDEDPKDQ